MRESNRITLLLDSEMVYNPDLGVMEGGDTSEVSLPCFVSDLGFEEKNQLLGKLDVEAKKVRFNNVLKYSFEKVKYNDDTYKVVKGTMNSKRNSFVIVEVSYES